MSTLGDVIIDAIQDLLHILFNPITKLIEDHANDLVETVVGTPHPDSVFGRPTNDAWPQIYDYYWDGIVPLSLFLWAGMLGLVILLESTSHLFSGYHRSKLKKRAFSGLLGVLTWWWIAALSLRFMSALTGYLVPDLSDISLFETLSFAGIGVLGLAISLSVDLILFVLIAVLYLARELVLYLFVLLMPILIVLWVPGVGPFALVSQFMKRLAGFYTPFLFMTVPVAVLFRVGELLGESVDPSMGGIGAWLLALVIPIVAVVSPLVLFWQAGALFFVADRAGRHVSPSRGRDRVATTGEASRTATQGGRDFSRGVQGRPPMDPSGQVLFESGASRAHAAGSRLRGTGVAVRDRVERRADGGRNRRGGGGGSEPGGRDTDFSLLRDSGGGRSRDSSGKRSGSNRGAGGRSSADDDSSGDT